MIAVPISKIENLQIMRFISTIFILFGGVLTGTGAESLLLALGVFMIIMGVIIEYLKVHRVMKEWIKSEQRGTISYTGSTVTDATEYEQAQE